MASTRIHAPRAPFTPLQHESRWGALANIAFPALELISFGSAARQGVELVSNGVHKARFVEQLGATQATLRASAVPVLVEESGSGASVVPPNDLKRRQRRWLGQLALELYFAQIFGSDTAIVDLSPSRLGVTSDGEAVWRPRPLYVRWDPSFLQGIRDVYAGFFLGDDARFTQGIAALELGSGGAALTRHFGDNSQRSVRFGFDELESTLRELTVARGPARGPLHPNFIAFGLYAASLHQLLESLDMAFDVRAAFNRIHRASK
jgi:hypothetical protein